jgi:hypothetical protein
MLKHPLKQCLGRAVSFYNIRGTAPNPLPAAPLIELFRDMQRYGLIDRETNSITPLAETIIKGSRECLRTAALYPTEMSCVPEYYANAKEHEIKRYFSTNHKLGMARIYLENIRFLRSLGVPLYEQSSAPTSEFRKFRDEKDTIRLEFDKCYTKNDLILRTRSLIDELY